MKYGDAAGWAAAPNDLQASVAGSCFWARSSDGTNLRATACEHAKQLEIVARDTYPTIAGKLEGSQSALDAFDGGRSS